MSKFNLTPAHGIGIAVVGSSAFWIVLAAAAYGCAHV